MPNITSKLVLGTANFGLKYGVANFAGKLSDEALKKILQNASQAGIKTFDTAQAYGDSEKRLGLFMGLEAKVITKIGDDLRGGYEAGIIRTGVKTSLDRLQRDRLKGILLHRPELLLGVDGRKIAADLQLVKDEGLVEKIGVSIYSSDVLDEITKLVQLDIVQVPFSIFDQRIYNSGWVDRLKADKVEIHARSVFLQGLLLMKRSELPTWFSVNWPFLFTDWFAYQDYVNQKADKIALSFVLQKPWIDKVIVGVDNHLQLLRLVEIEKDLSFETYEGFSIDDIRLVEPSNWKIQ